MTGASKPRRLPGALALVSIFLVASGASRLALIGAATAQSMSEEPVVSEEPPSLALQTIAPRLAELLRQAEERHVDLNAREQKLNEAEALLEAARAQIAVDLDRLAVAEEALRERIALADTAAEDDVARLTSVYENMAPEVAASLFDLMEPRFAAGFLGRMRPDAAAEILAGLSTEKAYSISVVLAGRNVGLVPQESGDRDDL